MFSYHLVIINVEQFDLLLYVIWNVQRLQCGDHTNISIIFKNLLYLLNFKSKQTCFKTLSHAFLFSFLSILSQSNLKALLDKHNNAAMTAFGYIYTRQQSYSIQFFTLYAALSCQCHFISLFKKLKIIKQRELQFQTLKICTHSNQVRL